MMTCSKCGGVYLTDYVCEECSALPPVRVQAVVRHLDDCDVNDHNPDGIRKPCNFGAELSVDAKRRLRAFARECIRNSGGDPDADKR